MSSRSKPLSRWDHRVVNRVLAIVARLVFRIYGRLRVIGLENVPATGGVLLAANHASYVDPPLGWCAVYPRRRTWGIAKSELWKSPVIGYLLDSMGVYPVKRGSADRAMFRMSLDLLARGEAVGIFPEGTRTPDGRLQPGRPGVGLLVQKSGVPIVPVAIVGTYEMLPRNRKSLRRTRLTVAFGPPLRFPASVEREEIVDTLMTAIAALLTVHGYPAEAVPCNSKAGEESETNAA